MLRSYKTVDLRKYENYYTQPILSLFTRLGSIFKVQGQKVLSRLYFVERKFHLSLYCEMSKHDTLDPRAVVNKLYGGCCV